MTRLGAILLLVAWAGGPAQAATPPSAPAVSVQAAERRREVGLPFLRNFSPKEYGADTQNWAVVQDPRGVIYVGNNKGVLEYDGLRWRLIPTANKTVARSLAVDATGRVYVGAVGEVGYLEPDAAGQMRYVSLLDRVPPEARDFADVFGTHATPDGIYFRTLQRLIRLRGRDVQVWNPTSIFLRFFRVRDRLFVLERGRGLLELIEGQLRLVPGADFADAMLPWEGTPLGSAAPGAVLIWAGPQGFGVLDDGSLHPFSTEVDAELKRDRVYSATRMPDGRVVFGTILGGLYVLDRSGRLLGHLDKARGLLDDGVKALLPDRDGGLWLGLERGIARVEAGSPLSRFDDRTALPGNVMVVARHQGRLYAGTGQGLFRLEWGAEPWFRPIEGVQGHTQALLSVGESLLVGNIGGVYEVRGDVGVRVLKAELGTVLHASGAAPGRVFVGSPSGLATLRRQGGHWVDEGPVPGVSSKIWTLLEMPDGRLWAGTVASGVLRVRFPREGTVEPAHPPQVERFGIAQGLPSLNLASVYSIGGQAVFATERGVFRFDEKAERFEPEPRFAHLFPGPRRVGPLAEGLDGRVWIDSLDEASGLREAGSAVPQPDGTYRWDARPLRPLADSTTSDVIWADDDGVVWLGGGDGLVRYDTRIAKNYAQGFAALVRQVSHPGGKGVLFGGAGEPTALALPWAENALRFEYAAPTFDSLEATRFQALLEGYDGDWSAWTAEGYREYTNLHEGAYRFRVRARNVYGTVSEEGVYAFTVLPPWYRTGWAYLGWLVAACGLGWGLVHWRMRRVEAEKRALEGTVAARTSELRAKNEQLETLNTVVRSINEQLDFDALLAVILRECRVISGVEKATALVRLPGSSVFTVRATLGWPSADFEGIELTLGEAEARYTAGAEEVSEDILVIRGGSGRAAEEERRLRASPNALLVLRIRIEEETEGYLVFENQQDVQAFAGPDIDLLKGLREHFVSAFQKARSLRLVEQSRAAAEERQRETETQRARAEEERARAEQASHAKSAFLSSMSHELRTPLNAILGFAQLMSRDRGRSPEDRERLGIMHRAGGHLLGLINDVLSLSKIEAGGVTLEAMPFDLHVMLESLEPLMRVRAEAKGLALVFDGVSTLPRHVVGDEGKLRQVLLNLMGNATKFTAEGSVRLQASWRDGRAAFAVADTGPGISTEDQARLFGNFVQTQVGISSREGTGLGLAISRGFVRLMGGDITVASEVGRGSTFTCTLDLPLAEGEVETKAVRTVTGLAPGQRALRTLVADDLPDNRKLLAGLLSSLGFEVREAVNGAEAVEVWRRERPDVIWMDIRMPVLDGPEAVRRIRAEEDGASRVPIVAVTASVFEHERASVLEAGFDAMLLKPFRAEEVFEALEKHAAVRFTYEEDEAAAPSAKAVSLTAERLAAVPRELLQELARALTESDHAQALAVTERMVAHDATLAADVRARLVAWEFDEIDDAVQATLGSSQ